MVFKVGSKNMSGLLSSNVQLKSEERNMDMNLIETMAICL